MVAPSLAHRNKKAPEGIESHLEAPLVNLLKVPFHKNSKRLQVMLSVCRNRKTAQVTIDPIATVMPIYKI
jgi:hypothetical protein